MNFSLKGFDFKNNPINLPEILWFEHFIGEFGFKETFKLCFLKNVPLGLTKVVVTKKNNKQFDFFVDKIELNNSKEGSFCIVFLKNNLCRLFENEVMPKVHKKFSLNIMLKKYAKEFNLTCPIEKVDEIEMENFYVDLGMTALDIIKFFFLCTYKMDIFLYHNKTLCFPCLYDVEIFFGDFKKSSKSSKKILSYTKLKTLDERSKLISDAYVKIVYEDNDSDFLHLTEENTYATNLNIKRVKYKNVPIHWQVLPKSGSDYMVVKQNRKRLTYKLTTTEDVEIYPGMLVKIKEISQEEELLVLEVLTSVKETGKKTKILLRNYSIK